MNVYLKSAVQNLDREIKRLQEIRGQLMDGFAAPVLGVDVFPPQPVVQAPERPAAEAMTPRKAARRALESGSRLRKAKRIATKGVRGAARLAATAREDARLTGAGGTPAVPGERKPANTTPVMPGERAKTLGGAMKIIIGAMGTFTRAVLREALEKKYGAEPFVKDASAGAFGANLTYWSTHGKLEQIGEGDDEAYQVVDKEFFGAVEFKS